jgi:hypothetical protein
MGLKECKAEDEGDFTCTVTTSAGTATHEFKLFVTVEGGMDFRAMLMKKKVKQKKVTTTKMEWIEPLVDRECQQNKDKQVGWTLDTNLHLTDLSPDYHDRQAVKGRLQGQVVPTE